MNLFLFRFITILVQVTYTLWLLILYVQGYWWWCFFCCFFVFFVCSSSVESL